MARRTTGKVALLSIHPRFAELIMAGIKLVEFRKVRFADEISHVVIYAAAPIKKIIGYFDVVGVEVDSINGLWKHYGKFGGIGKGEFLEYFGSASRGIALSVGCTYCLPKPLPLSSIGKAVKAPQNFIYLENAQVKRIVKACIANKMCGSRR